MKPDKGRIRLLATVPGAARIEPILSDFARGGNGIVTAFSERLLRVASDLTDSQDLEFLPFSEVVSRFLATAGGSALPLASGGLVLEALACACAELPHDSPFARAAKFHGTHKALLRTLEDLHESDISLSVLASALPQAVDGKLSSLALLERELRLKLEALGRTSLTELIDECTQSVGDAKLDRLLVLAGPGLCARNLRWLKWAAACGSRVTLVVERHAASGLLFDASRKAAIHLGLEPVATGSTNGLLDSLFCESQSEGPKPLVVKLIAPDRLAECEWAVRGCLQEMAGGTSPGRIGIFARDLEEYAPLLVSAGKRLGLPLSVSRRVPLLSNRFARMMLQTLTFASRNDARNLAPVVRSTYIGLGLEDQGLACEALKRAFRTRDGQWQALDEWAAAAGDAFSWMRSLLTWRSEALNQRGSLQEWIGRLRNLAGILPTNPFDSAPTSKRDARAQTALQRPLYHLASVEPERHSKPTLSEFQAVCARAWAAADVSLPETPGAVAVVDSADAIGAADVLFALGMLEGVFPRRRSEDPILTDDDRRTLSIQAENDWLTDSHMRAREERDEFYRLCASAGRKLVLSYPETDDQRDNVPAFYLTEVTRAMGGEGCVETVKPPRTRLVPDLGDCTAEADRRLSEALGKDKVDSPENILQTDVAKKAAGWIDERPMSPKELADVLECPFRFFVRRRLDIKTNRAARRWNTLRRLPQRTALLKRTDPAEAEAALQAALDSELEELLADLPPWELSMLRAGGKRLIRDWVRREFTARKIWPKSEGSIRAEVGFDEEGFRARISSQLRLGGGVPAASKLGPYKVSHLFESRSPERDRDSSRLEDHDFVYYGLHLLAQYEPGTGSALEVETMGAERTLFLLPRLAGDAYVGNAAEGLRVIDLSTRDDPRESVADFFTELKLKANLAARRIRELEVYASPGKQCAWCDLGELCRRSSVFGEEDPFEPEA